MTTIASPALLSVAEEWVFLLIDANQAISVESSRTIPHSRGT